MNQLEPIDLLTHIRRENIRIMAMKYFPFEITYKIMTRFILFGF